MSYSIEPRDRIYGKGYGFLSFVKNTIKNIGKHATKVDKNLNNKYSQNLFDSAKKSTTDAIKNASKRAVQNAAEATGDLIGNKIADKITCFKLSVSNKSSQNASKELHSQNNLEETKIEIEILKKRYIYPEKWQYVIDELWLI